MSDVTEWGTLILAGAVGLITYGQWRAAREQHRVDLFEQRFATYRAVMKAVSDARFTDNVEKAMFDLSEAGERARFLFRPEVAELVRTADRDVLAIRSIDRKLGNPGIQDADHKRLSTEAGQIDERLRIFQDQFVNAVTPDLDMHKMSTWWPIC